MTTQAEINLNIIDDLLRILWYSTKTPPMRYVEQPIRAAIADLEAVTYEDHLQINRVDEEEDELLNQRQELVRVLIGLLKSRRANPLSRELFETVKSEALLNLKKIFMKELGRTLDAEAKAEA